MEPSSLDKMNVRHLLAKTQKTIEDALEEYIFDGNDGNLPKETIAIYMDYMKNHMERYTDYRMKWTYDVETGFVDIHIIRKPDYNKITSEVVNG